MQAAMQAFSDPALMQQMMSAFSNPAGSRIDAILWWHRWCPIHCPKRREPGVRRPNALFAGTSSSRRAIPSAARPACWYGIPRCINEYTSTFGYRWSRGGSNWIYIIPAKIKTSLVNCKSGNLFSVPHNMKIINVNNIYVIANYDFNNKKKTINIRSSDAPYSISGCFFFRTFCFSLSQHRLQMDKRSGREGYKF